MKYTIHIGNKPITLQHDNFSEVLNVDDLTTVNTSNLFGEAVTINASANRIGLLRSEVESLLALKKLELKIFEGEFRAKLRKQAAENSGKFKIRVGNNDVEVKATEKALETAFETDTDWIELKKSYIKVEKEFNAISSLYWAVQNKARTLNTIISGTTPEDFIGGVVEGVVNGILVKKK